jgi:hypothetical protein
MWIPSKDCNRSMCPLSRFNASESSTFEPLQVEFNYMYGTGSINGSYVKDTVSLGGVSVSHQPFALANHVDKSIIAKDYKQRKKYHGDASVNGVLGLGFPSLVASSQPYDPLLFAMAKQGLIPELVFSIFTNSALAEGWSGEMTLGGINHQRYDGSLAYVDVLPIRLDDTSAEEVVMWVVQGQSIRIQNSNITILDPQVDNMKYILLDTGTSLSYVGSYYAAQLVSAVMAAKSNLDEKSGCYIVDCGLKNSTKQVEFEFARFSNGTAGTVQVSIPVRDLVQPRHVGQNVTGKDDTCLFSICSWPELNNKSNDEGDAKSHVFVFGDSILRSMYLVFDGVRNQTGFASPVGSQTKVTVAT